MDQTARGAWHLVKTSLRMALKEPWMWGLCLLMLALRTATLWTVWSPHLLLRLAVSVSGLFLLITLTTYAIAITEGRVWDLFTGLRAAAANWRSVVLFGGLQFTLSWLSQEGYLRGTLVSLALVVATLFVSPLVYVLATERLGPIVAFRRAVELFGRTWRLRLGALFWVFALSLIVAPVLYAVLVTWLALLPELGFAFVLACALFLSSLAAGTMEALFSTIASVAVLVSDFAPFFAHQITGVVITGGVLLMLSLVTSSLGLILDANVYSSTSGRNQITVELLTQSHAKAAA